MKDLLLNWDRLELNQENGEKDVLVIHKREDRNWEYVTAVERLGEVSELVELNGYDENDIALLPNTVIGAQALLEMLVIAGRTGCSGHSLFEMNYIDEGIKRGHLPEKFSKYIPLPC